MTKTIPERVSSLEKENEIVINHIQSDLKEVKGDVKKIALEMPELLRRVGKHHEVFNNHVKIIDGLKSGNCPAHNVVKEDNGERGKRKSDQKRYKYMLWAAIVGASSLILFLIGKLGSMLITFGEILEQLPK